MNLKIKMLPTLGHMSQGRVGANIWNLKKKKRKEKEEFVK